ncbi:MAG: hypothetical protein QME66_09155 [Candidatus Eisenbacteria bacterium]|nr:hypothetical protein [Candidatus Eisenbacteria bacterium]
MMESVREATVERLFESAIEIEYAAADIYKKLSVLFSHEPRVHAFWRGLFDDEVRHATTLQDVLGSLTPEQLLLPPDMEMWNNIVRIQRMFRKDLVGPIDNLDAAYELAHDLEFSEVNAIFKFLAGEFVPSEERKRFVHSEIVQHLQKLTHFGENFGEKGWRKEISVRPS